MRSYVKVFGFMNNFNNFISQISNCIHLLPLPIFLFFKHFATSLFSKRMYPQLPSLPSSHSSPPLALPSLTPDTVVHSSAFPSSHSNPPSCPLQPQEKIISVRGVCVQPDVLGAQSHVWKLRLSLRLPHHQQPINSDNKIGGKKD